MEQQQIEKDKDKDKDKDKLPNNQEHETEKQLRMASAGSLLDLSNSASHYPSSPNSSSSSSAPILPPIKSQSLSTDQPSESTDNALPSTTNLSNNTNNNANSLSDSNTTTNPIPVPGSLGPLHTSLQARKIENSAYQDLPTPIYQRKSYGSPTSVLTPPNDTHAQHQTTPGSGPPSHSRRPASSSSIGSISSSFVGRGGHHAHLLPPKEVTDTWQDYDHGVWKCTQKSMDGVSLSAETISNLFNEFVIRYHPILPVVDISRGPQKIYMLCPSLFWTIMTVASRRYDRDGKLMLKLTPLLKTCLSEITISPVTKFAPGDCPKPFLNVASVYTVQAFIIFTMWPSITSSLSADSSWNTAGLAMYSAIRVGLHCPGYARDFGRIKADNPIYPQISEQIRTWICCNIVSQTVATVYGFPAFTSFDASVISACQSNSSVDVPETIKKLMMVEHLEEEIAKTLNSNPKDPLGLSDLSERLSLIQILSRKLDELEMQLGEVDNLCRFVLLGARVHLLTYYFLDNGGYTELQLEKGIIQVYNSALALMEHADMANSHDRTFFKYLPGIYAQILWQSTAIICKVYHSPFSRFVDAEAGQVYYFSCVSLISKASIFKHDMMYRASEIMQQVWRLYASLARHNAIPPRIRIRTRMSASVFFDALWTMREECGIRSAAPAILNQRNTEEEEEDDEDGEVDEEDDYEYDEEDDEGIMSKSPDHNKGIINNDETREEIMSDINNKSVEVNQTPTMAMNSDSPLTQTKRGSISPRSTTGIADRNSESFENQQVDVRINLEEKSLPVLNPSSGPTSSPVPVPGSVSAPVSTTSPSASGISKASLSPKTVGSPIARIQQQQQPVSIRRNSIDSNVAASSVPFTEPIQFRKDRLHSPQQRQNQNQQRQQQQQQHQQQQQQQQVPLSVTKPEEPAVVKKATKRKRRPRQPKNQSVQSEGNNNTANAIATNVASSSSSRFTASNHSQPIVPDGSTGNGQFITPSGPNGPISTSSIQNVSGTTIKSNNNGNNNNSLISSNTLPPSSSIPSQTASYSQSSFPTHMTLTGANIGSEPSLQNMESLPTSSPLVTSILPGQPVPNTNNGYQQQLPQSGIPNPNPNPNPNSNNTGISTTTSPDDMLLSWNTEFIRDVALLMSDYGFRDDEVFPIDSLQGSYGPYGYSGTTSGVASGAGTNTPTASSSQPGGISTAFPINNNNNNNNSNNNANTTNNNNNNNNNQVNFGNFY